MTPEALKPNKHQFNTEGIELIFPNGLKKALSTVKWIYVVNLVLPILILIYIIMGLLVAWFKGGVYYGEYDFSWFSLIVIFNGMTLIYLGNEMRIFLQEFYSDSTNTAYKYILLAGVGGIISYLANHGLITYIRTIEIPYSGTEENVRFIKEIFTEICTYSIFISILNILLFLSLFYGLYKFLTFIDKYLSEHFLYNQLQGKFWLVFLVPLIEIFSNLLSIYTFFTILQKVEEIQDIRGLWEVVKHLEKLSETIEPIFANFHALSGVVLTIGYILFIYSSYILFMYSIHLLERFFNFHYFPRTNPLVRELKQSNQQTGT